MILFLTVDIINLLKQHTMQLRNAKTTTIINSIYDIEDEVVELEDFGFDKKSYKICSVINIKNPTYKFVVYYNETEDVLEIKRDGKFVDILSLEEAKELFWDKVR